MASSDVDNVGRAISYSFGLVVIAATIMLLLLGVPKRYRVDFPFRLNFNATQKYIKH